MDNNQTPVLRIAIRSPDLDVFRIDESYDIRKFVINKQKSLMLKVLIPQIFPNYSKNFNQFVIVKSMLILYP